MSKEIVLFLWGTSVSFAALWGFGVLRRALPFARSHAGDLAMTDSSFLRLFLGLAIALSPALRIFARRDPNLMRKLGLFGWPVHLDESVFFSARVLTSILVATIVGLISLAALGAGSTPICLLVSVSAGLMIGMVIPVLIIRRRYLSQLDALTQRFPNLLEAIALCLESGQSLALAFERCTAKLSLGRYNHWERMVREISVNYRRGLDRDAALTKFHESAPVNVVYQFCSLCRMSERTGASIAPILRQAAEQARSERHLAMERRALEAPVKLLAPLVCCIFPCTFIVLLAPIIVRLKGTL
ncbi:MAG: type II secretion system F family protein [Betaproteobacteria bacterium]|nr:type II secretion system F family protein [Betaproteobacteria bacterium]NBT74638.1 type II secretion system F family protein [Betaproteobacteria bacterium]NBY13896.1 type II secretion system F family protein [Betaproteobacteria bacterium]NCA15891.1 type II secretion system F family protein [Betaproteobacteria bacterium]NDF03531.1 type II secretion system F family protein [Betaproteobacteria bacterium]